MDFSSGDSRQDASNAIAVLRTITRTTLKNEPQAQALINDAMRNAGMAGRDKPTTDLGNWVYALALIYTHQTGLLPAFTNCENETRFERFVFALPAPPQLQLTRNRLKAAIRRLDLKRNSAFSRDLDALSASAAI